MASNNTDFLRFSAYSLKDLIIRKLSEDSKFTDQIYEGSNINILIDLVSYMYQCLVYQLNTAASESMFSDTQLYENITRLVGLLGYNPKGIVPSSSTFYIRNLLNEDDVYSLNGYIIPRYSYVDTNKSDQDGNRIYYSVKQANVIDSDREYYRFHMYNGIWKMYNTIYTASGSEYETFQLQIGSDIDNKKYVADRCIDVYVQEPDGTVSQWEQADNLFVNLSRDVTTDNTDVTLTNTSQYGIFQSDSKIYSIRLNEDKNYEIKFGNGLIGRKLTEGSKVYIFYLQTNGLNGTITPDYFSENDIYLKSRLDSFGLDKELIGSLFPEYKESKLITSTQIVDEGIAYVQLENTSSTASAQEDVESIRRNAPNYYKLGNRLVTNQDYQYYVGSQDHVVDCICQNNWEYITDFYRWLYYHGMKSHSNPMYYISEQRLTLNGYRFSDPSDSNNIYIWTKMETEDVRNIADEWKTTINLIKTNTTDVTFLNPIMVNFAICAADHSNALNYLKQDTFDENNENYIEITIENNATYVNAVIQTEVRNIIEKYFNVKNLKLGQVVNYDDMIKDIMSINGVNRIRTIWQNPYDENDVNIRDGLCFASWSDSMIDPEDDFTVTNTMKKIENFQFPTLYKTPQIKVIKKSLNSSNIVQY